MSSSQSLTVALLKSLVKTVRGEKGLRHAYIALRSEGFNSNLPTNIPYPVTMEFPSRLFFSPAGSTNLDSFAGLSLHVCKSPGYDTRRDNCARYVYAAQLGGSGWGVTNVSCQLKFWPFVSCQLNFGPFVSCQ